MRIGKNQVLPNVCFHCAQHASASYRVTRVTSSAGGPDAAEVGGRLALAGCLGVFGVLLGALFKWRTGREALSFDLPICESCATHVKPSPDAIDFEADTMTFAVHKKFKDAASTQATT